MYEALIAACQAVDAFGLPRAMGRFEADRFIFANNSFLQAIGVERDEIASLALSGVVKIHLSSPEAAKAGRLAPITVRSLQKRVTISGHAVFDDNGLTRRMRQTKKTRTFRKRTKSNPKVTIQSISLACERFFLSRGMPDREPFIRWGRHAVRQEEDELA